MKCSYCGKKFNPVSVKTEGTIQKAWICYQTDYVCPYCDHDNTPFRTADEDSVLEWMFDDNYEPQPEETI